jgi:hypothetical protein
VLSRAKTFVARETHPKRGPGVVEIRVNALSAVLQHAGLSRPPGYASAVELVLIALGNRATGPTGIERFAADALEVALFGQGIQAQDADDQLVQLQHPIKAKTEAALVVEAADTGWPWLTTGGVDSAVQAVPRSGSWRARSRLTLSLYGGSAAREAEPLVADGEALEVSSAAAVSRSIEAAAQQAAVRVQELMTRKRAGRSTIAVMLSGYQDQTFIARVLRDLRRTPGVEGAALTAWAVDDTMASINAYATGLSADALAATLINRDPALRVVGVESEDNRLTVEGEQIPAGEDKGQDQ